jgi:hypothetical protein
MKLDVLLTHIVEKSSLRFFIMGFDVEERCSGMIRGQLIAAAGP